MATCTPKDLPPRPERWAPLFVDHRISTASTIDHSEAPSHREVYELYWPVVLGTGGVATGKTVAVAQWFQTLKCTACEWLTLTRADDRPPRRPTPKGG